MWYCFYTSNNQRLRSVGNNDRRSKRFCSIAVLCISFTWQMVKTHVIRLQVVERSKRMWSNGVMCIPLILSGSPNKCWLHMCNACVIKTWRLGLRAPLLTHKYMAGFFPTSATQSPLNISKVAWQASKGAKEGKENGRGVAFPLSFPFHFPSFTFLFHACHSQAANRYLVTSPPNHLVTNEITIQNRLNLAQHRFELSWTEVS